MGCPEIPEHIQEGPCEIVLEARPEPRRDT